MAGRTDEDLFASLCTDHIHLNPSVVTTRRLGKAQTNKPQLLCIVLATNDQAGDIQRRVKLLRNSSDEVIRTFVFINANLTPAERKSSYDQRCLRRQRGVTRSMSAPTAVSNRLPTAHAHTSAESSSGVDDHQDVEQLRIMNVICIHCNTNCNVNSNINCSNAQPFAHSDVQQTMYAACSNVGDVICGDQSISR